MPPGSESPKPDGNDVTWLIGALAGSVPAADSVPGTSVSARLWSAKRAPNLKLEMFSKPGFHVASSWP